MLFKDHLKIVTDAGAVLHLGWDYDTPYFLDPLNGVDIDLKTAQGRNQVGDTVEDQVVSGVSRTLSVVFWGADALSRARAFTKKLPYFTKGTLYFGDHYFTRFVLQKTPYFSSYTPDPRCELMLYSEKPCWYDLTAVSSVLGGYRKAFSFPVCYDSHIYGIKQDGTAAVLRNDGSLPVPFTATLRCDMPVEHPKVVDLKTGAFIGFDLTLQPDDTLEIYRSTSDRLACTLTRAGVTENIFAKLDEDSTLTELQPGDNILSMQAESGAGYLQASVSFYPMEAGHPARTAMRLDVLEADTLTRVGWVDVWVSLYWDSPYYSEGSFTLEVRPTTENLLLLQEGRWLVRSDEDPRIPMRICSRANQNEDSNLVVSGYPATWLLTKRVSAVSIKNQNAEAAMRSLVEAAKPWPRLELGTEYGFDTVFEKQTSGGTLFDYCQTIGQACDLGFRIVLDGKGDSKRLLFECFRPTFDPNNRFAPQWGNLLNAGWAFSDTDYANVALVQGAGEGDSRATVWVGDVDATGSDRREMYVDARDLQPEDGEINTSQSYLQKLADRGGEKLLAQLRTGSIEFNVDDDSLQVGDVLRASLPQLGYTAMVRVADIITQSEESGTTRTIRLGTPTWTKT